MNEEALNQRLQELIREIANPSTDKQQQLTPPVEETNEKHAKNKESTNKILKSLGDLRICIKYLMFDLEATRRERDRLKERFKNQPPKDDDKPNKAT